MEKHNRKAKADYDPAFDDQNLDQEEREIELAISRGEFRPVSQATLKRRLKKLYSAKPKRSPKVPVTMRMEGITLAVLKDQARTQGLRYQTLISSVLHKYITGQLVERKK